MLKAATLLNNYQSTLSNNAISDFETPRREKSEHSKPLDCFPVTGLLDDDDFDFDESFFDQIDHICQQKSAAKSIGCNENDINGGDVNLSPGSISASGSVGSGELLKHLADFDSKECTDHQNGTQNGNMPEEYSKYLQSLNDRQREVACTDISTPLLIVAGPGSGKVLTFSFLYTLDFLWLLLPQIFKYKTYLANLMLINLVKIT